MKLSSGGIPTYVKLLPGPLSSITVWVAILASMHGTARADHLLSNPFEGFLVPAPSEHGSGVRSPIGSETTYNGPRGSSERRSPRRCGRVRKISAGAKPGGEPIRSRASPETTVPPRLDRALCLHRLPVRRLNFLQNQLYFIASKGVPLRADSVIEPEIVITEMPNSIAVRFKRNFYLEY